ncbi:hypothetical protein C8F04DRAFT_1237205 [Mycena alexandri]|uniref:Uncharacterized protein n=1 Tax=Mycena alexandri TaxID=1745969 RepID=A0AAD6SLD4_9AGAR|nr:hypothetical protein C8F04DRAFT_1237205 [Mycena alexandri]
MVYNVNWAQVPDQHFLSRNLFHNHLLNFDIIGDILLLSTLLQCQNVTIGDKYYVRIRLSRLSRLVQDVKDVKDAIVPKTWHLSQTLKDTQGELKEEWGGLKRYTETKSGSFDDTRSSRKSNGEYKTLTAEGLTGLSCGLVLYAPGREITCGADPRSLNVLVSGCVGWIVHLAGSAIEKKAGRVDLSEPRSGRVNFTCGNQIWWIGKGAVVAGKKKGRVPPGELATKSAGRFPRCGSQQLCAVLLQPAGDEAREIGNGGGRGRKEAVGSTNIHV